MDDLKTMLRDKADGMRLAPEMPPHLRGRSRRRRLRNASVAFAVVGAIGLGAYTGLRFAPEPAGPRPVTPVGPHSDGPQYEFANISVRPGEFESDKNHHIATVFFSYDFETYPGVHLCTWRLLDSAGSVVGLDTRMFAQTEPSVDQTAAFEVRVAQQPTTAEITCEPLRLDTPGIADTDGYPIANSSDGAARMIEQRVQEWMERFAVDRMTDKTKAANAEALRLAAHLLANEISGDGSSRWLEFQELLTRAEFLGSGRLDVPSIVRTGGQELR